VFLPYFLERTGKEWVAYNREYSPLGCAVPHFKPTREDFAAVGYFAKRKKNVSERGEKALASMNKGLDRYAADISLHGLDDSKTTPTILLYDDGCLPDRDEKSWNMYQLRLEALCLAGSAGRKTKRLKEIIKLLKGIA
jgi:hypothetical protein